MIMKTLTINGQTFIVVDADAMKKIADSDLDMNGRIIRNVSDGNEDTDAATVGQVKAVDLTMEKTLTDEQKELARTNIGAPRGSNAAVYLEVEGVRESQVEISAVIPLIDKNGVPKSGIVEFRNVSHGIPVRLVNIKNGATDTDAATVGQVKAVDLTMEKTLTDEQKAQARKNIGALGEIAYVRSIEILGTYQNEIVTITSGSGPDQDTAALLLSPSDDRMNPPIIRNVSDGVQDNDVATVGQLNAAVGDIETSLDSIIAIQESLIGGDAV